jgi:tRNA(Ile2) C34 agmatinyltransferase TiaS
MPNLNMEYMHINSAYLCPDCNSIGNNSQRCPACTSTMLLSLASVLNREVEEEQMLPYAYPRAVASLAAMVA